MMNSCSVELWNVLLGRGVGDVYIVAFFGYLYASILCRQMPIFRFWRLFGRMTDHGGVCQDQSGHE